MAWPQGPVSDTGAGLVVEYALTEDDFAAFNEYTLTRSRWARRRRLQANVMMFIWPIIGFVVGTLLMAAYLGNFRLLANPAAVLSGMKAALFVSLFIGGLLWVTRGRRIRRAALRRARDGSFANFFKPSRLELCEDGVHYDGASGNGLIRWSAFIDMARTGEVLYLYTTSTHALIVPRRALGTAAFEVFAYRAGELREKAGVTA